MQHRFFRVVVLREENLQGQTSPEFIKNKINELCQGQGYSPVLLIVSQVIRSLLDGHRARISCTMARAGRQTAPGRERRRADAELRPALRRGARSPAAPCLHGRPPRVKRQGFCVGDW